MRSGCIYRLPGKREDSGYGKIEHRSLQVSASSMGSWKTTCILVPEPSAERKKLSLKRSQHLWPELSLWYKGCLDVVPFGFPTTLPEGRGQQPHPHILG